MNNKNIHRALYLTIILTIIGCKSDAKWIEDLPKPWTLTENEFSNILQKFGERYPDFYDRLKYFSKWQIGKPYKIFCLGEEIQPDPDPIFRMDVSDCTVHILTSLASVQSNNWSEAKSNLIKIHYKSDSEGKHVPHYDKRWHFTTDRLLDNPSTKNITETLFNPDKIEKIDLTLNQKENGDEFLDIKWTKKVAVHFIPNQMIDAHLMKKIPSVTGVAFVKKAYFKMGLIIAHEGIIIDNKDIIHASQEFGKTVQMDFLDYYFTDNKARFDGVVFFSFHPLEG